MPGRWSYAWPPREMGRQAMNEELPAPRSAVVELRAYDPQAHEVPINLSANENSFGLPAPMRERLKTLVGQLDFNRYPDPGATELKREIAATHGVEPEQVAVGNGGDELIQALLLSYGGPDRTAVAFTPTFAMYEILAKVTGTRFCGFERDVAFNLPTDAAAMAASVDSRITFVCSPNNPTGNAIDAQMIAELAKAVDGLIVVDEAYQEFGRSTALDLLEDHPNLVVLRTFSKAFSLAGLRVGYLVGDARVIDNINKVRLPYNVNSFSQAAAAALLRDSGDIEDIIEQIVAERARLSAALAGLDGCSVYPSEANFLLVKCVRPADEVWRALLDDGILVRAFSGARRLRNCLRITVGTPAENDTVIEALRRIG